MNRELKKHNRSSLRAVFDHVFVIGFSTEKPGRKIVIQMFILIVNFNPRSAIV